VSGNDAGENVGRYRLGAVIGRGGSSVVHRAVVRVRPAVAVAVKIARNEPGADVRRSFVDQERRSDAIRHPSVLPVLDAGDGGGRPYLVMPLVEGSDLSRALAAHSLTVGRMLVALRQIAAGLDALHRSGLLHLDVKPANVLLGRVAGQDDAGHRAYLADLGLCRSRDQGGRGETGGGFSGSPRYASPEQLDGRSVCGAADVYSLTCLLYACLAGHPPFVGDMADVLEGHHSGRPPSLAGLTGLPASIDAVIARGLAPDPADRHGSCGQLVSDAGAVLIA
jgi:serine/threonine protein kinase